MQISKIGEATRGQCWGDGLWTLLLSYRKHQHFKHNQKGKYRNYWPQGLSYHRVFAQHRVSQPRTFFPFSLKYRLFGEAFAEHAV